MTETETDRLSAFFSRNTYISGKYADESSFSKLNTHILSLPGGSEANRLFYLALPPTVYHDVTMNIKHCCMSTKSVHTRLLLTAAVSVFTSLSVFLLCVNACKYTELEEAVSGMSSVTSFYVQFSYFFGGDVNCASLFM